MDIQETLLRSIEKLSLVEDSAVFSREHALDHALVVGAIKSLESRQMVTTEIAESQEWNLSSEARQILRDGSHEARVFHAIPEGVEGITQANLVDRVGDAAKIGMGKAIKAGWVRVDPGTKNLIRAAHSVDDQVQNWLKSIADNPNSPPCGDEVLTDLKKRKLISLELAKSYRILKGPEFSLKIEKQATDLTAEMISSENWKTTSFKRYNFNARGLPPSGGHLHPLLKVRQEFRQIFLEMGFSEMPTNAFVESSFWNFDALFQPQQHPARDLHDTFFLKYPVEALQLGPTDYVDRVKDVHENGGYGSSGYRYNWKLEEAQKNLLRTHTTAVSARMLYLLGQEKQFVPKKYFSIDRVYRNESVDATHLAEFHQIEGVIADRNLTLGHLIGVLKEFFSRLGIVELKFKPAYNPYTEPSMEVFSYHAGLKKWVEVGNSGVFRPEMLEPMGLPADVVVIAWGLSLERPTMIKYGISNIRDLVGHKVDMEMVYNNPICRLEK